MTQERMTAEEYRDFIASGRSPGTKLPPQGKAPDPILYWFHIEGIPEPDTEHRFCERRWRFDYAWPAHMVALEVEGGAWTQGRHVRGKGYINDMHKYNRATLDGWRVFRTTPDELMTNATAEMLKRALGRAEESR